MKNVFNIQAKTILITGASSGFGHYIAELYAEQGANLIICARRQERLEHLKAQILNSSAVDVQLYTLDVNDRSAVQAMLEDLEAKNIKIDVLVNNAGVGANNRFLDTTNEEWDTVLGTNLKAPWLCSQEIAKSMVKHKVAGAIINITSVLSDAISIGVAPYCASKAGLKHLTGAMAVELARYNIRANAIAPGYMITEINEDYLNSDAGQKMLKSIPMRRFMEFADLDGVLLLFASDASRGMTGVEIKVDGGHCLAPI